MANDKEIPGPLSGLKVVECGHWYLAPLAGQLLGDLGADVIKVEERGHGDPTRSITDVGDLAGMMIGRTISFECANRNKRGITLDLRKEKGREVIYELCKGADIFITNLRQQALEKFKIDYENIARHNSRIIYAYGCGWGSEGDLADKPALETAALARSGAMYSVGEANTPPSLYATGLGDMMAAWNLLQGVLAAIVARERFGYGQKVEVSLFGSLVAWQALSIMTKSISGNELPRRARKDYRNALLNCYRCSDGRWLQLSMAQSDRYWHDFCEAMGIGHLEKDPKFTDFAARKRNAEELVSILDEIFAKKSRDEWMEYLSEAKGDFIYAPNQFAAEILEDPQALANDYITYFDHCVWGRRKVVGHSCKFSRSRPSLRTAAPEFGEHTEEVLVELGYTWEDISQLKEGEVI